VCRLVVATSAAIATPVQWTTASGGNGHWYDIARVSGQLWWDDARLAAQGASYLGLPGHLATITSEAEDTFLAGSGLLSGLSTPGPWLGGF